MKISKPIYSSIWFAAFVIVLVALARLTAIIDGRDPGFDQAMLMANFPLGNLGALFKPLPYFEQATALGSVIELELITRAFGEIGITRFTVTRVVAAMVAVAGYILLFLVLSRRVNVPVAILSVALMASTNEVLLFTTNPKNYVNAFFFACLLLYAAHRLLDQPTKPNWLYFLVAIFLTPIFAFTAPVIFAAIFGGLMIAVAGSGSGNASPVVRLRKRDVLIAMLPALVFSGLLFLLYNSPATEFDFTAYSDRRALAYIDPWAPLSSESISALGDVLRTFAEMVIPVYFVALLAKLGLVGWLPAIYFLIAVVWAIGSVRFFKYSRLMGGGLIAGLLTMLALNMAGKLPIQSSRHFMFFAPFAVPCFVVGVETLFSLFWRRPSAFTGSVFAISSVVLALLAILRSGDLKNNEVSENLVLISENPAKMWVYYGAQPSLLALRRDLLDRKDIEVVGLLPYNSSTESWHRAARDDRNHLTSAEYDAASAELLAGTEPVWLLFAHSWPERFIEGGLERFFVFAEMDGRTCLSRSRFGGTLAFCALDDQIPSRIRNEFR